jgi:hypothetical protein
MKALILINFFPSKSEPKAKKYLSLFELISIAGVAGRTRYKLNLFGRFFGSYRQTKAVLTFILF